ncbi:unnamed protein product [Effrenium voratum]|nr:unnamed protein product [Effrenium voratum]
MPVAEWLYAAHSSLELLAGSLLFVRGRGSMDANEQDPQKRLYRRWHGAGLLGLSALGWLSLQKGLTTTASKALAVFHGAAVAVHFLAAGECASKGSDVVSLKAASLSPHIPLFVGFVMHAAGKL